MRNLEHPMHFSTFAIKNGNLKPVVVKHPDAKFENEWNLLLEDATYASVMQSPFAWKLFNATEDFHPVLCCCYDEDNVMKGSLLGVLIRETGILKQRFSTRVVVYGGPVIQKGIRNADEVIRLLFDALIRETERKSIFIQVRAAFDMKPFQPVMEQLGFTWSPRLNLLINTSDENRVWKDMSASRRRQVRKSLENGAQVISDISEEQLHAFYNILKDLYREKIKKPLPGYSFFKAFHQLNKSGKHGHIFLIIYNRQVIGGIMSPSGSNGTVFEWYVCGLDKEYKSKGIYPSVLATWAAIEYAVKDGFRKFDFMGVGKPGEDYGVRDFKMRFGGSIVNFGRYIRINNRFLYSISELGYNILSLLKKV